MTSRIASAKTMDDLLGIDDEREDEGSFLAETESETAVFDGIHTFPEMRLDGSRALTSQIRYRDYDPGRNLRSLWLHNPETGKSHNLGRASSQFQPLSPWQAFEPLLKAGYEPKVVRTLRGGARTFAIFASPSDLSWEDMITWDGLPPTTQQVAISATFDARVGHGLKYTRGVLRLVCTNGLISEVLKMGSIRFPHHQFDSDKLLSWAGGYSGGANVTGTLPTWNLGAVRDFNETLGVLMGEDVDRQERYAQVTPDFARKPFDQLTSLIPQGAWPQVQNQLGQLIDSGPRAVNALDILNAFTNVGEANVAAQRLYFAVDRIGQAAANALDISSFRAGLLGTRN